MFQAGSQPTLKKNSILKKRIGSMGDKIVCPPKNVLDPWGGPLRSRAGRLGRRQPRGLTDFKLNSPEQPQIIVVNGYQIF
jgi:hypothetical protein